MTDITCRIIVMKDNRYFRGAAVYANGNVMYRFSPHVYDARKFKTLESAQRIAGKVNGCVRLFAALNGEII